MPVYENLYQQREKESGGRRRKQSIIAVLLVVVVVLTIIGFQKHRAPIQVPEETTTCDDITAVPEDSASSNVVDNRSESETPPVETETVSGTVRSGQSFYSIMVAQRFSPPTIATMVEAFKGIYDCSKISSGDEYRIVTNQDGDLVRFTIMTSPVEIFTLSQTEGGFVAAKEDVVLEKEVCKISGTIEHSLFGAMATTGEKDQLAIQFADIFAWDIDFSIDLREGDQFTMVFEKYFKDGEFVWYGNILAAEYRNDKKTCQAIYYKDSECGEDYFTPEGHSLRRSFLRSPLRFTRISSGYSHRRLHPVLKTYRPHLGIDFAAPTGTPVWSVADGVVIRKGWKNGNGNMVSIRHPNGYETMYNHLCRYGKGIKKGKHVKQKDIIGYVGSTGLSTGPHLDYRMKKNGTFINPLKQKFPLGTPVPDASQAQFQQVAEHLLAVLADEGAPMETVVALVGNRE